MASPRQVTAIVQARLGSTRLPRKVLAPILGKPMIAHVLRRAKQILSVDQVILAVPKADESRFLEVLPESLVMCAAEEEPLARYITVVKALGLRDGDYIVRLTGDCPGLDPQLSDMVVRLALGLDYSYYDNLTHWPDGLDTQVFTVGLLKEWADIAYNRPTSPVEAMWAKEHVTPLISHPSPLSSLPGGPGRDYKWSVDTESDLEYVRELYAGLGPDWGWRDALELSPGKVCPLCADGVPHPQRSLTSIGGTPEVVIEDLHEVNVSGGVGYWECLAFEINRRAHKLSTS